MEELHTVQAATPPPTTAGDHLEFHSDLLAHMQADRKGMIKQRDALTKARLRSSRCPYMGILGGTPTLTKAQQWGPSPSPSLATSPEVFQRVKLERDQLLADSSNRPPKSHISLFCLLHLFCRFSPTLALLTRWDLCLLAGPLKSTTTVHCARRAHPCVFLYCSQASIPPLSSDSALIWQECERLSSEKGEAMPCYALPLSLQLAHPVAARPSPNPHFPGHPALPRDGSDLSGARGPCPP
jgi:hypothetical protein